MSPSRLFVEEPRIVWHGPRPFALARLPTEYARRLEDVAHRHADGILGQPLAADDPGAGQTATARRYGRYNVFLLDPACLTLFLAIRETYRCLVRALDGERRERFIKGWYNISTAGQGIASHRHEALYIGTFAARAEGSQTVYRSPENASAFVLEHRDGGLMLTTGAHHAHESPPWGDPDVARVTYAFDIVNAARWRPDRVQVPFDGDFA